MGSSSTRGRGGGGGVSLTILGLFLLGALVAGCWKNKQATFVALVAVMLGMIIAGSSGALSGVAQSLIEGLRTALDAFGRSLFGA